MAHPKSLLSDLSNTLLFARNPEYTGTLNGLHKRLFEADPSYDFWSHFSLDEVLFDQYKTLTEHIPLYLYTTGKIQDVPVLRPRLDEIFNHTFAVSRLDWPKNDPDSFQKIAARIGLSTPDILYVDDSEKNLEVAKMAGMQTLQRISSEQLVTMIKDMFG